VVSLQCIETPEVFGHLTKKSYCFLAGGGGGKLALIGADEGKINPQGHLQSKLFSTQLMGGVNSISIEKDQDGYQTDTVWVGTSQGNTYTVSLDARQFEKSGSKFDPVLKDTSHFSKINDMCFPVDCSQLFITAADDSIRIWNCEYGQELVRILVNNPEVVCNCVEITQRGDLILSGWSDGKIRLFKPESGKLHYVVDNAHHQSVTSLAVCKTVDGPLRVVSGGEDGRVRVWDIKTDSNGRVYHDMKSSLKEHRSVVRSIKITNDNFRFVSASEDGSCIIWQMGDNGVNRENALFAKTCFKGVVYHPQEDQLLTCGSDRKITYWSTYDDSDAAKCIRMLEGSDPGPSGGSINCVDIQKDGEAFAIAGDDKQVKIYNYDEGECIAVGEGHSGSIKALKISPDSSTVASVGEEGAIMIWDMPR